MNMTGMGPVDVRPQRRPGTPLLDVSDLQFSFGQIRVLKSVNLHIGHGETVALLGPNGAGKTTMLRALAGVLRPQAGAVMLDGERVDQLRADRLARRGVALVPEGRKIFPAHTVEENLQLGGYRWGSSRRVFDEQMTTVFDLFPRLSERRSQMAATLSGGEAQMLAFGRALMLRPRLLMLDEPSLGLAPRVVGEMYDHIRRLRTDGGLAVLLVEQAATLALEVADRAYLLDDGSIAADGSSEEMRSHPEMRRVYFGS